MSGSKFHKTTIWISVAIFLTSALLVGCSSIETPPDSTIVWSDDFEDGDLDGWFEHPTHASDIFFVEEGALAFGQEGGFIGHSSNVLYGTWSFDIYLIDKIGRNLAGMRFTEGVTNDQNIFIDNMPNTQVIIFNQFDTTDPQEKSVDLGERVTGWHHFDITKDENNVIRVYMDGDFLLELFDDRPYETERIYLFASFEGPAFDNIVVSDAVLYSE